MTFLFDDKIRYDDSPNVASFGRLRTSPGRLLGEYRYQYNTNHSFEMNDKIVGGGTLVGDYTRNSWLATVGTASGDRVVRQTKQYHPYISGATTRGLVTFTLAQTKANLVQSVGLFDDLNGIFFQISGSTVQLVIRKNGTDVQTVPQASWSNDRLDGTKNKFNPSGILADWTKSQILCIDYQWLGIGRVSVGFVYDAQVHYVHHFNHSNIVTEVYTTQPSLPIRWEIENSGVTASSSQMMLICGGVYSEGSDVETGYSRAISTGTSTVSVTTANSSNGYGILAIRLIDTIADKENRSLARLKGWAVSSNGDVNYKVVILPSTAAISGTPTWTKVPGVGWCEHLKDFALESTWATGDNFITLFDGLSPGTAGDNSQNTSITGSENRSNAIYQNFDSTDSLIFAIVGYRLNVDVLVRANMHWLEVK